MKSRRKELQELWQAYLDTTPSFVDLCHIATCQGFPWSLRVSATRQVLDGYARLPVPQEPDALRYILRDFPRFRREAAELLIKHSDDFRDFDRTLEHCPRLRKLVWQRIIQLGRDALRHALYCAPAFAVKAADRLMERDRPYLDDLLSILGRIPSRRKRAWALLKPRLRECSEASLLNTMEDVHLTWCRDEIIGHLLRRRKLPVVILASLLHRFQSFRVRIARKILAEPNNSTQKRSALSVVLACSDEPALRPHARKAARLLLDDDGLAQHVLEEIAERFPEFQSEIAPKIIPPPPPSPHERLRSFCEKHSAELAEAPPKEKKLKSVRRRKRVIVCRGHPRSGAGI